MSKNFNTFMKDFCYDSILVLEKYDAMINEKLVNDDCKDFYINERKGLSIFSMTEPIIKF